ncbi:MAG: tRNA uridine-5-carboxymethylaminomethyl(34) synthesis GTPase MnmE [Bacteroidota bacterium]
MLALQDSIVAISTPAGSGALGVIRLSGPQSVEIVNQVFSKDLSQAPGYSLHFGQIKREAEVLDEVVLSVFRAPRSFTKEDTVEISCHGSSFILREVMLLLVEKGARLAEPGEFTQRAFLHGAMDLAQAEAVADLIAASSAGAHRVAMQQMRGGISKELSHLRSQLLDFTSLIELELDFGEEDVEFADRSQLEALISQMLTQTESLISSFRLGNALKQGIPTVILGKPNAGKSTLLNALLQDNRAIVSNIPGTTRDVIEDRVIIQGVEFRLMDTAGVRETTDVIEAEGVRRSLALAEQASLLLYLFDCQTETPAEAEAYLQHLDLPDSVSILSLANKADTLPDSEAYTQAHTAATTYPWLLLSAQQQTQLDALKALMLEQVAQLGDHQTSQPLVSNLRHLHALQKAQAALLEVQQGLANGLTGDLLSIDIRTVLHYIGEITGEISTDEVLGNIFGKFCIGK